MFFCKSMIDFNCPIIPLFDLWLLSNSPQLAPSNPASTSDLSRPDVIKIYKHFIHGLHRSSDPAKTRAHRLARVSGFRKYLHKTFNLRQYFVLIGNFPLASMDISHKRQTFSREPIAKYLVLYSTQQTESSHSKFLQNFSFVMINESTEF